ncbi:MAG TPA: TIGR02453 family protein [Candidatus Dormibacteraeota bacterium]|nr:TIGR02453 family protein [Candidatus Dormibacteraeota bacterium]
MAARYFSPKSFEFFEELERNNNRDWFLKNKSRYENEVREPMLAFIAAFAPQLKKISACYVADPRPSGGSMMRIYRNLRFSRDKTPYKTNAASAFGHRDAGHFEAPSFYLSLSAAEGFAGVGIWHPQPEVAGKIRDAIVTRAQSWEKAIDDRKFRARFELGGEKLTRPPRGYDPAHPLIEDLKRKDFIGATQFTRKEVCSDQFLNQFTGACVAAAPFMKFLTEALGHKW